MKTHKQTMQKRSEYDGILTAKVNEIIQFAKDGGTLTESFDRAKADIEELRIKIRTLDWVMGLVD